MIKKISVVFFVFLLAGVSCRTDSQSKKEVEDNIVSELKIVAKEMDEKIEGAMKATYAAAAKAEEIYRSQKSAPKRNIDKGIYYRDHLGILSDHGHKMSSTVYIDRSTSVDAYTQWYINATEQMAPIWEDNFRKYPYLGWQYILETRDTSLRIYPWLDTTTSFGPSVKFRELGFYLCSLPENNPKHELKFSRIGMDILGLGLLVSPSVPIYLDGRLVAISGMDFLITKTFEDFLFRKFAGKNTYLMLVDGRTTQVILRNNRNRGGRGWDSLFDYSYLDKFAEDHPEFKEVLNRFISDKIGMIEISMPNEKRIYFRKLDNINWIVAIVTEA